MTGRTVLFVALALAACKKKTEDASAPPSSGEKRVDWQKQTGPGFTVEAPGPAKVEKVPAVDADERAFDRYTFHTAPRESYVVEITELPAKVDPNMALHNKRMLISTRTQSIRNEDFLDGGGLDLRYWADEGDDTLHARSKLITNGQQLIEIRGISPESADAAVDRFVDSFAITP